MRLTAQVAPRGQSMAEGSLKSATPPRLRWARPRPRVPSAIQRDRVIQSSSAQLAYCLPHGSCLRQRLVSSMPTSRIIMPKSRGRKPKKNRPASPAAPTKPANNFGDTPQVSSRSILPAQEPPPAAAPDGERAASKIKQIARTLFRWLRITG